MGIKFKTNSPRLLIASDSLHPLQWLKWPRRCSTAQEIARFDPPFAAAFRLVVRAGKQLQKHLCVDISEMTIRLSKHSPTARPSQLSDLPSYLERLLAPLFLSLYNGKSEPFSLTTRSPKFRPDAPISDARMPLWDSPKWVTIIRRLA